MRLSAILSISLLLCCACNGARPRREDPPVKAAAAGPERQADNQALRVMSYNVLQYGAGCQGPDDKLHPYLRRIVTYARPDILGLLKVAAIGDRAPKGFQDSILRHAMGGMTYAVCPYSNKAGGKDVNLLFYNSSRLGFGGMRTLASDITDINLFRLYEKPAASADTSFLFVVLIHTESGDKSGDRDRQLSELLDGLRRRYSSLPPLIILGDFNLRNTSEPGYALLTQKGTPPPFSDPPFALDKSLSYPADWDSDPEPYARYLTTSTRKKDDEPNDCGTGGGAKSWYDHILLSQAIATGKGGYHYVPGSFQVVGNDGGRIGHAVQSGKHPNASVPADVVEALFQFSNKYPVMLRLSR